VFFLLANISLLPKSLIWLFLATKAARSFLHSSNELDIMKLLLIRKKTLGLLTNIQFSGTVQTIVECYLILNIYHIFSLRVSTTRNYGRTLVPISVDTHKWPAGFFHWFPSANKAIPTSHMTNFLFVPLCFPFSLAKSDSRG